MDLEANDEEVSWEWTQSMEVRNQEMLTEICEVDTEPQRDQNHGGGPW